MSDASVTRFRPATVDDLDDGVEARNAGTDQPIHRRPTRRTPKNNPTIIRLTAASSYDLLCLDLPTAERVRATLDPTHSSAVAGTLKVFADPTRLRIAQALSEEELCGCDLGWITGQSDKVVSHHLGRLRREGFVHSRRDGKVVTSLTVRGRAAIELLARTIA